MIDTPINWELIARAITYYQGCGYRYVETPWLVTEEASEVTFSEADPLISGLVPVGSAEQGFIQLMLNGQLPPGNYVSAGPCFRPADGDLPDHNPWFFKVELIKVQPLRPDSLMDCLETAQGVMESLKSAKIEVVPTSEGYDLTLGGLEVGSYGIRTYKDWSWVFGTGLAEPRYSLAVERATG